MSLWSFNKRQEKDPSAKNPKGKLEPSWACLCSVAVGSGTAARPKRRTRELGLQQEGQQEGLSCPSQELSGGELFLFLYFLCQFFCNFARGGSGDLGVVLFFAGASALLCSFTTPIAHTYSFGLSLYLGTPLAIKWRCPYIPSAKAF